MNYFFQILNLNTWKFNSEYFAPSENSKRVEHFKVFKFLSECLTHEIFFHRVFWRKLKCYVKIFGTKKIFKKLLSVNWNSFRWNSKWGNKCLFLKYAPSSLASTLIFYASIAERRYFNCVLLILRERLLYHRRHESTRDDFFLSV